MTASNNGGGPSLPPRMYRTVWLLGGVSDPMDYARDLGKSWLGFPLPVRDLRASGVMAGHAEICVEVLAADAMEAMVETGALVLDVVKATGRPGPGRIITTVTLPPASGRPSS